MLRVSRAPSVQSVLGMVPESMLAASLRCARLVWFPAAAPQSIIRDMIWGHSRTETLRHVLG